MFIHVYIYIYVYIHVYVVAMLRYTVIMISVIIAKLSFVSCHYRAFILLTFVLLEAHAKKAYVLICGYVFQMGGTESRCGVNQRPHMLNPKRVLAWDDIAIWPEMTLFSDAPSCAASKSGWSVLRLGNFGSRPPAKNNNITSTRVGN